MQKGKHYSNLEKILFCYSSVWICTTAEVWANLWRNSKREEGFTSEVPWWRPASPTSAVAAEVYRLMTLKSLWLPLDMYLYLMWVLSLQSGEILGSKIGFLSVRGVPHEAEVCLQNQQKHILACYESKLSTRVAGDSSAPATAVVH